MARKANKKVTNIELELETELIKLGYEFSSQTRKQFKRTSIKNAKAFLRSKNGINYNNKKHSLVRTDYYRLKEKTPYQNYLEYKIKSFKCKDDGKSYVYFIGSLEHGFCKIGTSVDPYKRIKAIQTGCPFKVEILLLLEGSYEREKKAHKYFYKHKSYGEWFKIEGKVKTFLDSKELIGSKCV